MCFLVKYFYQYTIIHVSASIMDCTHLFKVQTEEEDDKGKLVFICEEENQVCLFTFNFRQKRLHFGAPHYTVISSFGILSTEHMLKDSLSIRVL